MFQFDNLFLGSISAAAMSGRASLQPQDTEELASPIRDDSPSDIQNENDKNIRILHQHLRPEKSINSVKIGAATLKQDQAPLSPKSKLPVITVEPSGFIPASTQGASKDTSWERKLTLRSCINLQNALGKKSGGNAPQTSGNQTGKASQLTVTALVFSKDHKALHVGDSQGRVTTWLSHGGGKWIL